MYIYEKKGSALKVIIYVTLVGIIVFLSTYIFYLEKVEGENISNKYVSYSGKSNEVNTNNLQSTSILAGYNDACNIFEKSIRSIVGITAIELEANNLFDKNVSNSLNMGSGIIVSSKGYILTNQHVAGSQNDRVYVTLFDGSEYNGRTVWADMVLDLAIVKIDAPNLQVANLGNSDNLKLGESVYAIGNPLGLDFQRTITSGIVSALNRTIKVNDKTGAGYMENLIQTDASINPGNSGGALINANGEVIGVNTIKVAEAEGIGFAIPINTVSAIIQSFENSGFFEEAYLGIFAYDNILLSYSNARTMLNQGILVANIDKFGPLTNSKIELGNILLSIDNISLNSMVELRKYLYTKNPGDVVTIKFADSLGTRYTEQIILDKKK